MYFYVLVVEMVTMLHIMVTILKQVVVEGDDRTDVWTFVIEILMLIYIYLNILNLCTSIFLFFKVLFYCTVNYTAIIAVWKSC